MNGHQAVTRLRRLGEVALQERGHVLDRRCSRRVLGVLRMFGFLLLLRVLRIFGLLGLNLQAGQTDHNEHREQYVR